MLPEVEDEEQHFTNWWETNYQWCQSPFLL